MITIVRLQKATPAAAEELSALASALHADERRIALKDLKQIVDDPRIVLMVVKDRGRIIGMGVLYINPKVGNVASYIEDVIVGEEYRGQGLGEKLVRALIEAAKENSVRTISLTSRPTREAANKLYQKLGFTRKETNVYRLLL